MTDHVDPLVRDYPTLFYHTVTDPSTVELMADLRVLYVDLGAAILTVCPPNRSRSLAMTELETSLMRAIQSLALSGALVDPRVQEGP